MPEMPPLDPPLNFLRLCEYGEIMNYFHCVENDMLKCDGCVVF